MIEDLQEFGKSQFETMAEQLAELQKHMREQGEAALKDHFKTLFTENPDIQGVSWAQYVPVFNDGEPCEFSLTEIYYKVVGIEEPKYGWHEDGDVGGEGYTDLSGFYDHTKYYWEHPENAGKVAAAEGYPYHDTPLPEDARMETYAAYNGAIRYRVFYDVDPIFDTLYALEKALSTNSEILQMAFGSNCAITVTPEEVRITDYDCGY